MNRFDEAGIRVKRQEMIRRGAPEAIWARIPVPEGTRAGDKWQSGEYLVTAEEDEGEDGMAAVFIWLHPVKGPIVTNVM